MLEDAPLVTREQQFHCKSDLISLGSGWQGAGFEGLLQSLVSRLDKFMTKYLRCTAIYVSFPTLERFEGRLPQSFSTYLASKGCKKIAPEA
jgi:hypothetical protein